MVDMELVRQWGKANYPFLVKNDDAILKLYKSRVLHENVVEKVRYTAPYKEIQFLEEGVPSMIVTVKIALERKVEKEVCARCGRANCTDNSHDGKVEKVGGSYSVADSSGMISAFFFDTPERIQKYDDTERAILFGVRNTKLTFGTSFNVKDFIPITAEQEQGIHDLVDFITIYAVNGELEESKYTQWLGGRSNQNIINSIEKYFIVKRENGKVIINM